MISLAESPNLKTFIEKQLQDRGLKLDPETLDEWEDHKYKTKDNVLNNLYIGYAIEPLVPGSKCKCSTPPAINRNCGAHDQSVVVMIQGNQVYELEEFWRWSKRTPIAKVKKSEKRFEKVNFSYPFLRNKVLDM